MKHIFKFIVIIIQTLCYIIKSVLMTIWDFKLGLKPFRNKNRFWIGRSEGFDYHIIGWMYCMLYTYQPRELEDEFKSVFHYMWGFAPIRSLENEFQDFGYVTDKKCIVCGNINTRAEPRFNYSVCVDHFKMSPIKLSKYIDIEPSVNISNKLNELLLEAKNDSINYQPDILKSIKREISKMDANDEWDWIYFFFDLHGTIIKPNFEVGNTDIEYYPLAKETLQLISNRSDLRLCIYTCSHEHEIKEYARKFKEDGIEFRFVNENPEVPTSGYGNYDKKPYMNVLFEDKSGFFGETDWPPVYEYFKNRYYE